MPHMVLLQMCLALCLTARHDKPASMCYFARQHVYNHHLLPTVTTWTCPLQVAVVRPGPCTPAQPTTSNAQTSSRFPPEVYSEHLHHRSTGTIADRTQQQSNPMILSGMLAAAAGLVSRTLQQRCVVTLPPSSSSCPHVLPWLCAGGPPAAPTSAA